MNDIEAFYKGVLLGMIFVFSLGPVFFAVIETSISRGFFSAACVALGAVASDALYILVAFLGVSFFLENETFQKALTLAGGVSLCIFGVLYFLKKPGVQQAKELLTEIEIRKFEKEQAEKHQPRMLDYAGHAVKGFSMNSLNPFLLVFWIGAVGVVSVETDSNTDEVLFFSGSLTAIITFDLLKAFVAAKIKHLLTRNVMLIFNRIAGCVTIFFGVRLLWKFFHG